MYAHVLVCAGCLFPLIVRIFMYCWYGFFIAIHRLKFNGAIIKWNSLLHVIMLTIAINRYTLIWAATATAATLITKPNWTSSRFFMNKKCSLIQRCSTHIVLLINAINKYNLLNDAGAIVNSEQMQEHTNMNVFQSIPYKNDPVFTANENICYVSNTLRTMHLLCLIMIIIMHVHLSRELISSFYAV